MRITFWGMVGYIIWIVVFLAAVNLIMGNVASAISAIP